MKTIKKIKNNLGKVAGSALLVGATFATGGAMVTAQDSGSSGDLGDFPAPFVSEDGEVDTSVVVGETAQDGQPVSTLDVVSGIEIAGSLGNAAFMESEESVDVSGTSGTWSAENGITLNRDNTNLFINDGSGDGITRIDEQDVSALEATSFQSADSNEVEVEHDVQVSDQSQEFSTEGDYDNPILHLNVPSSVSSSDSDHLFQATVEFSDSVDFHDAGATGGDDVDAEEYLEDGDEIELFGTEYTFSDESGEDELVLYGSSDRVEVNTGEESTVTVDGNEVTLGSTYVSGQNAATVTVNGQTESVSEGDSVGPNGNIRISDIYQTGPDGQGRVAFSQGSDEVRIDRTGNEVEVDGETVDGVYVSVDGGDDTDFSTTEGMTFYFGAADSDEDFIEQGEMYEDPLFGLQFHYGGLNPDTADEDNAAETIEVDAPEEDVSDVTFTTADGEELTVPVHTFTDDVDSDESVFGSEDGTIAQYEGEAVMEDDQVILNAFEEASMYEVTDVSDSDLDTTGTDSELSVTMENVATGDSVTVEEDGLDLDGDTTHTLQDESIGGNDFHVTFEGGEEVSFVRSTAGQDRQLWPAMYTSTDAAVAFDAGDVDLDGSGGVNPGIDAGAAFDVTDADFSGSTTTVSNQPSNGDTVGFSGTPSGSNIEVDLIDGGTVEDTLEFADGTSTDTVSLDGGESIDEVVIRGTASNSVDIDISPGGTSTDLATISTTTADFTAELPSGVASNDATASVTFSDTNTVDSASVDSDFVQYSLETNTESGVDYLDLAERNSNMESGVLLAQPENDDDQEEAYVIETQSDSSGVADVAAYTGYETSKVGLDDEDVTVNYDEFGAYVSDDEESSDSETLSINMPSGQATAGMAFTGADGSLSAEGGGSGSVTSMTPTYEFAEGVLDSDSNVGQVQNSDNLILVGGPSVNSLVAELADEGDTWSADEYTEGEGLIQHVPNAFSEGQDAVIVAGYAGEDTRAAGEFLADYRNNEGALEGNQQVTISTESGQVVN